MAAAPASGPFSICLALLLVLTVGAASLSGLDDVEAVAELDSTLPDCHADGGCGAEDEQPAALVELLQMGLQISGLAKAEVNSSAAVEGALQVNSSAVAEAAFQVNRSIPYLGFRKVNTSIPALSVQKELPACSSLPFHGSQPTPLNLQIQMGFLASLGYEQHRYRSCQEITPLGVTYEVRTPGSAASPTTTASGILKSIPLAIWLFIGYLLIFVIVLGRMYYMLLSSSVEQPKNANYRPEATSWKAGFLSWISISWVNPWICRWGNATESTSTKIKSQDLGQTGWADMEAANTIEEWDRLWNQDVAKKGTYHTNMYIVVMKFCTIRKIMQLAILTFVFEVCMSLGPTILVDRTLRYMEELQLHHLRDGHPTSWEKQAPVVVAVCALYTGIPLAMCIFNTVATLMGTRMYVRLQSALLAAVYRKAQRMPITGHSYDLSEPDDDKAPKMLAGDGAGGMKGKNYSLVQLCNSDINANLMNFQNVLVKIITQVPLLIGICVLMFWKLGLATFIVAGMIIGMSLLIAFLVRQQFIRFGWFQACVGGRLAFFQEVMHSIRMFKSNAFEPAGIQILFDCRMREMQQLSWYYFWMGMVLAAMMAYPKVVALGGLASYESMHAGGVKAADVFVMIQILNAFKGVCNSLIQVIPQVAGMFPSLQRVDRMLKLKEANLPGDKTQHMDKKWLTLWPEEGPEKPLFLGERQGTDVKPALRCQGSFLWSEAGKVALSDIDIQVHQGELVAIMGEVGSGKSTLLAAMLGELYPTRDSRLEIPKRIAYHSQVPVIAEATLKDNILYWSEHDEKRYKEAIHAACLLPDLQILPGGDMVPIGSRGISLSGGQKARVSLARAAYARDAPVVLIDDPFASVDVPTGRHLMDNCLRGPLMKDRVRVVVCQPDRQRVKVFDRIYIMAEGRIAAAGTPEEVIATPEYQALLSKYEASMLQDELEAGPVANQSVNMENFERTVDTSTANRQQAVALREEEHEGRADSSTIKFFLALGGYKFLTVGTFLLVGTSVLSLFSDLVLVRWSNQIMQSEILGISVPDGRPFLSGSAIWWAISLGCFGLSWFCGIRFICNISGWVHNLIVDRLFKAPVDRFYDKTPVGRIMNRMSFDMTDIDLQMFWKFQGVLNTIIAYLIPLVYVHIVMPTYLILGSIPFYTLIFVLVSRYWNTMVPLRYLTAISRSHFNSYVTEVDHDTVTSRAYQTFNAVSAKEMEAVDDMIKAEYANICVSRWTTTRVLLTYSVFGTVVAALSVMVLAKQGANVGTVGMCLGHLSFMIMGSEGFLLQLTDAQFQFISMNRLHEYSDLPEEKAQVQENDYKYNSPVVQVSRQHMGSLEVQREGCLLKIVRVKGDGTKELVLEQMPDIQAFQPPDGKTMAILAPENPALHYTAPWHRLHAVDGVAKDAAAMAEVLCQDVPQGTVWLNIRSGWLAGGAKIVLTDLVIGYADLPNNVLNGVNFTIEARSKTAIAGATGCGKSTTILALLRMLEPRGGKVEINGVDLQTIGLLTLRRSMGLVPQDPVLFSGTIRNNIDVFAMYTDNEVWAALKAVQLADFVHKSGVGLDMYVKSDGDNISFGQKQLLCIARQVLRNPELLLLDECTSAIDPHTQELVQDTIRSNFPDSTLIAIAHRLETIMDFDTVIVLDKGRVVERGAISELSHAKNGWFAKMLHAKGRA